jgi:hypothetical protein
MSPRFVSLFATAAFFAGLAVVPAVASADAQQTPVVTGCPAGYALFAVPAPGTSPYKMPAMLDNPANGGNGDGLVCAHQLPEAVVAAYCNNLEPKACVLLAEGLPLYNFTEDDSPAQGANSVLDFGS